MNVLVKRLLLAVLIPVALLLLVEAGLRWAGQGVSARLYPVSMWEGRRLATQNPHYTRPFFGARLERAPWPVAFPVPKPTDEYRVFLLGESAALGDPIPEYGMARILEVLLQERMPDRRVRVVNSAITAINSHVIRGIAAEVARLEPDAVVVYMGNNEVVGPFGPGTVFTAIGGHPGLIRLAIAARRTHLGQRLMDVAGRMNRKPVEWTGMEMFLDRRIEADDPRLTAMRRLFGQNLDAILEPFATRHIPVVLSTVAVNLRDCSPLGATGTNHPSARAFLAAQQAERAGDVSGARALYRDAMERDPLRFRADAAINTAIRAAASVWPVRLVDGEAIIAAASPDELPGETLFFDHVHLTYEGQYRLARAFAAALDESSALLGADLVARQLGWSEFSEREAWYDMFARRLRPPFAHQIDREEVEQRWIDRLIAAVTALPSAAPDGEIRVLEAAVAVRGDRDADIWRQLGVSSLAAGQADRAAAAFARAAALWPHMKDLRLSQATALAAAGREREAFPLIRNDARWARWSEDAIWADLGTRLIASGLPDAAKRLFHQAWLLNPDNPDVLVNLGASQAMAGQKREAIVTLRRAVAMKPQDAVVWANLGRALFEVGDTAEGLTALEKAASLDPDNALTLASLGVAYLRERKLAASRRCLERALDIRPLDVPILEDAIALALAETRFADVAALQERIARLSPADALAQHRAGQWWMKIDQPLRALPYFHRALELAPGRVDWRRGLVWLLATHPDDTVRDPARAQPMAEPLAQAGGESWMNLDVRAAVSAANGNMVEALDLSRRIDTNEVPAEFRDRVAQRTDGYRAGKPYLGTRAEYIPE